MAAGYGRASTGFFIDFDADKQMQYKELRLAMSTVYEDEISLFGPRASTPFPSNFKELSKEEKDETKRQHKKSKELIEKGTKQKQEKVKVIRQNFAKAVVAGTRRGSGKIVFEFYDKLVLIWGGSPNTRPLPYGVKGDDFLDDPQTDEDEVRYDAIDQQIQIEELEEEDEFDDNGEKQGVKESANASIYSQSKRKLGCVPQLIDNKHKNRERNLSAAQQDHLLLKEAKEDSKFKKHLTDVMHESSGKFGDSVKSIGKSMTQLGAGISHSIEMLSRAIMQQNQQPQGQGISQPYNQNVFYHQQQQPQQFDYPPRSHMMHQISTSGSYTPCLNLQITPESESDNTTYYFK